MAINPRAAQYFRDNPEAKYWYANTHIRIPNPNVRRDPLYTPEPWPTTHELANSVE
jgi:hypothetical protein